MESIMNNQFLLNCITCNSPFFTEGEKKFYESRNLALPKRCKACREIKKQQCEQREKEKKLKHLLSRLPFRQSTMENLKLNDSEETLYIVGNGFDIMHGVSSNYYCFRDSLGKSSDILGALENYLTPEDIWADFEDSLAHINGGAMLTTLDMWLDINEVYSRNAKASDFFMSVEAAVEPTFTIMNELPGKFRKWISSLKSIAGRKPLEQVIHKNAKYITFNYTEFLETIYGIPESQILYIHGCRKKKDQKLILGHAPGAADKDDVEDFYHPHYRSKRKNELYEAALETAIRHIVEYDEETTKKTPEIIRTNKNFFNELRNVKDIVVIGHSLSEVDYPYFNEILKVNKNASWHISWYSLEDLQRMIRFVKKLGINEKEVEIWRNITN